jgi:hypothetical protein
MIGGWWITMSRFGIGATQKKAPLIGRKFMNNLTAIGE